MYREPAYCTPEEVRVLLDLYIQNYVYSDYYRWAVISKENQECIGQIAFFLVDNQNHYAEIEYCIGSQFQKRGLATEMTRAIIQFGFEKVHFHKIQICHMAHNLASKQVILKCGFQYEGTIRECIYQDGMYVDKLYYSILRKEYILINMECYIKSMYNSY